MVCDAIGWIGGNVVEQLGHWLGFRVLGEFVVHGPGIIEQGANDALHGFDTGIVQQWAVVIIGEELFLGSIDDYTMLMWQVLQLGWGVGVVILDEEVLDVPIHGRLACMLCIVPIQVDSGKLFPVQSVVTL